MPLFGNGKPSDPKRCIDYNFTATVRTNETKYSASTRIPLRLLDSALSEYFRHAGDRFAEESAIFRLRFVVFSLLKVIWPTKRSFSGWSRRWKLPTMSLRRMWSARRWKLLSVIPWTIFNASPFPSLRIACHRQYWRTDWRWHTLSSLTPC